MRLTDFSNRGQKERFENSKIISLSDKVYPEGHFYFCRRRSTGNKMVSDIQKVLRNRLRLFLAHSGDPLHQIGRIFDADVGRF